MLRHYKGDTTLGYLLFQVDVELTLRGPHETNTEIEHGYNG